MLSEREQKMPMNYMTVWSTTKDAYELYDSLVNINEWNVEKLFRIYYTKLSTMKLNIHQNYYFC